MAVSRRTRYMRLLVLLRPLARAHGYALALHGSMERDLDLIAVPWIVEADSAEVLVETVRGAVNGYITDGIDVPTLKPHGRRAWAIRPLDDNPAGDLYIDLSVMPRS